MRELYGTNRNNRAAFKPLFTFVLEKSRMGLHIPNPVSIVPHGAHELQSNLLNR